MLKNDTHIPLIDKKKNTAEHPTRLKNHFGTPLSEKNPWQGKKSYMSCRQLEFKSNQNKPNLAYLPLQKNHPASNLPSPNRCDQSVDAQHSRHDLNGMAHLNQSIQHTNQWCSIDFTIILPIIFES